MQVEEQRRTEFKTWKPLQGTVIPLENSPEATPYSIAEKNRHKMVICNTFMNDKYANIVIRPVPIDRVNLNGYHSLSPIDLMRGEYSCLMGRVVCREMAEVSDIYFGSKNDELLVVPHEGDFAFLLTPGAPIKKRSERFDGDPQDFSDLAEISISEQ